MACVGTVPEWTAAGAGRAAPGVTASVSAIMPAAAAAAAGSGPGLTRLQGVKLWSSFQKKTLRRSAGCQKFERGEKK